jgi:2-amino-4-hydroxy-6-hydroxymethyldihydropteridine diphosphokinase
MVPSLVALGSNLGERAAILESAVRAMNDAPGVNLTDCSRIHATPPVGSVNSQDEFLNGVASIETSLEPEELLHLLQQIEMDHGRQRRERWAARSLDLDLLLYDDCVIRSASLAVPHPRMSFRRFVLEPAVEIAGRWQHPTIGWTLDQLLYHLDWGADRLAIVSPHERLRGELATTVAERCAAPIDSADTTLEDSTRWPAAHTAWVSMPAGTGQRDRPRHLPDSAVAIPAYPAANLPKLTVLLDPPQTATTGAAGAAWSALAGQPGRGPTLRIPPCDTGFMQQEVFAAIASVWPGLCPTGARRLK